LKDVPDTAAIPIIFITALDDEDNMVKGLNIGGDDYIAKPLSMKEVKARVKAVLRRSASTNKPNESSKEQADTILYEGITLCLDSKTATLDGNDLPLTRLEFELLSLLLQNPNRVFPREELLKRCWPQDAYVLDRTVDVNITRLRKKLGSYGNQIKTRIGYGYIFEK
jgi:DNA-binding response OmpR family regulator